MNEATGLTGAGIVVNVAGVGHLVDEGEWSSETTLEIGGVGTTAPTGANGTLSYAVPPGDLASGLGVALAAAASVPVTIS